MKLSPELIDLENKLRNVCGTKVAIKNKGEKGKIEIEYYNNDDLNRILAIFLMRNWHKPLGNKGFKPFLVLTAIFFTIEKFSRSV